MEQFHQKIFSIEEANKLVPFLSRTFTKIFELNEEAKSLDVSISDLLNIWGDEVTNIGNIDYEIYSERLARRKEIHANMHEMFDEISSTGAVIKDLETGLVDFYAKRGNEIVMLCWKFGEGGIKFWHPVATGFSKRKPVSELKK